MTIGEQNPVSVTEALRRRTTPTVFEEISTHLPGVTLRIEAGTSPELSRRETAKFAGNAILHVGLAIYQKGLDAVQSRREEHLKNTARAHEGLRGVVARVQNAKSNVIPRTSIDWVREPLQSALGPNYTSAVGEGYEVNISLPPDIITDKGPLTADRAKDTLHTALMVGLGVLGISQDVSSKIVTTEIKLRVDETEVYRLITAGHVASEAINAAGVVKETWAVQPSRIRQ